MTDSSRDFRNDYALVIEIPVQWGDMDALAHVNNVVYLTWFESARIHYMEKIGFMAQMKTDSIGPILASTNVRYRVPVEYPDRMLVGVKALEFSENELIHEYGVFSLQKDVVTTLGQARMVMFDFNAQKKTTIPFEVLEKIKEVESRV